MYRASEPHVSRWLLLFVFHLHKRTAQVDAGDEMAAPNYQVDE